MKHIYAVGLTINSLIAVWLMVDKNPPTWIALTVAAAAFYAWHLTKEKE